MSAGDALLQSYLTANATYAAKFSATDDALLKELQKGQSPKVCWLGCSDSRVSPEMSTGVKPGSIFVHRNVAQCFHLDDGSALSAIFYAVHHLKVDSIVVCGHTGCGGVRGAMTEAVSEAAHGPAVLSAEGDITVQRWIAPVKQLALAQLARNSSDDPFAPHSLAALTQNHVAETVCLIAESWIVKDAWKEGHYLSIHGWMYHVGTAKIRDLDVGYSGDGIPIESKSPVSHFSDYEPSY